MQLLVSLLPRSIDMCFIRGMTLCHAFAQVLVRLLVASMPVKIAWGRVLTDELCTSRLIYVPLIVGVGSSVLFTACDIENLPVAHGLPSPTDDRRFTASLNSDGKQLTPTYLGGGTYEIIVQVGTRGTHSLSVELDSTEAVASLSMQAACPDVGRTVQLPGGEPLLGS